MTTALTVNILRQEFDEVLTNPTVLTWSKELSLLFKCQGEKGQKKFAVLEIDEASLSRVTKYIQPKLFVLRIFSATKWIAMVKFIRRIA